MGPAKARKGCPTWPPDYRWKRAMGPRGFRPWSPLPVDEFLRCRARSFGGDPLVCPNGHGKLVLESQRNRDRRLGADLCALCFSARRSDQSKRGPRIARLGPPDLQARKAIRSLETRCLALNSQSARYCCIEATVEHDSLFALSRCNQSHATPRHPMNPHIVLRIVRRMQ